MYHFQNQLQNTKLTVIKTLHGVFQKEEKATKSNSETTNQEKAKNIAKKLLLIFKSILQVLQLQTNGNAEEHA